jgi:catechol 2,3-dioxygenase
VSTYTYDRAGQLTDITHANGGTVLARSAYTLACAADHGVSVALYLRELDGNDVELYWDRPEANWPRQPDGMLAMFTHALDLQALLHVS